MLNPDNGHYYALLGRQSNWDAARIEAETYSFLGVPGHLATITSAAEQSYLIQSFPSQASSWIGASDAAVEGEWRWVTGPEAGDLFWMGGVDGFSVAYSNWRVDAPNNNPGYGGQDYARVVGTLWNDTQASYETGGIVEFSVPEPSSIALLTLGVVATVVWRRAFVASDSPRR
jgi:hypothetical protein